MRENLISFFSPLYSRWRHDGNMELFVIQLVQDGNCLQHDTDIVRVSRLIPLDASEGPPLENNHLLPIRFQG